MTWALSVQAQSQGGEQLTKEQLAAKLNSIDIGNVFDSPLEDMYELRLGTKVAYVTKDGHYLIEGDLYDLNSAKNLTEMGRSAERRTLLSGVSRDQMLVFAPKDGPAKYTVTIFTDVDCGYCRQFHRDIDVVNSLGIEVHYLFYPRTGPDTESWYKAEKVWCAKDRNKTFTNAIIAGAVPDATCADTPVASDFDLGRQVGVVGTPAIIAPNGDYIGGYLAPDALLATLDSLSK